MKNRISENPGRVLITPENGSAPFYATMARADNPTQEGDPLDKNTLLKDATAALFGLGVDAVPDDVLSMLYPVTNYVWKRRAAGYAEKRTAAPSGSNFYLAYGSNSSNCSQTVEYSAEIEISSTTGEVSLKDPQTLTIPWSGGPAIAAVLKGMYVKNTYSSPDDIVFISSSATINNNSSSSAYWVLIGTPNSNVFIISSEITATGDWSIVYAPGRNTYPDNGISNGYEYVFLGNPLDNAISAAKIETVSYVGTGVGGSEANATTLEVPEFAKIVVIVGFGNTSKSELGSGVFVKPNVVPSNFGYGGFGGYDTMRFYLTKWVNTTLSWYTAVTSNSTINQLNDSNAIYVAYCIG